MSFFSPSFPVLKLDIKTIEADMDNQKSAKKPNLEMKVKEEPSTQYAIKLEPKVYEDSDENIELLANLNLESCTSNMTQMKQEFNNTITDVNTTIMDDADLKFHLAQQGNSSKFLFYWFDAYEDQYNQQGTVFLFGNDH